MFALYSINLRAHSAPYGINTVRQRPQFCQTRSQLRLQTLLLCQDFTLNFRDFCWVDRPVRVKPETALDAIPPREQIRPKFRTEPWNTLDFRGDNIGRGLNAIGLKRSLSPRSDILNGRSLISN
jgi:hypothetical protein